jgi:dTDP-4-dehydrorhamnose reductase
MEKRFLQCDFELWGGIECTLNRIGELYYDQLELTGHYNRPDDIDRLASLGLSRMRYPVLWEKHQPTAQAAVDWSWASRQLNGLRRNGIDPIVGLVHHGSGPGFTDLSDPQFAFGLSAYAGAVARQFPWVEYYTPVNEPLTTARFSGLYGFWYPHSRNDLMFLKMLINQVKGVVLSMKEIRKVNPDAKLVQTDDLGKVYADPTLKYQADFENERRWLTFDLLCGKVDRDHSLWGYLRWLGLKEEDLFFFQDNPCPPDVAGFNYYVTSERYLDPKVEHYPPHLRGGNHRHRYVDTEAIRIKHNHRSGLVVLLMEAWDRFHLPMAITEAFLSCTEDEQVRWLYDVCHQASEARQKGADIRAVTFWALFGEMGWNKLVTTMTDAEYESGAFDTRPETPRETMICSFIRALSRDGKFDEEWVVDEGWWRRSDRFHLHDPCLAK